MTNAHEPMRLTVREAVLINRNFSGRKTDYNEEGNRNFCIVLDWEHAAKLKEDGWLVKYDSRIEKGEPIEEGTEKNPFLPAHLGYAFRPPKVIMIPPNGNKIRLDEEDLNNLDWADIIRADVVVTARHWEKAGRAGMKTWVKTLVVWIDEDELEAEHHLNEMHNKSADDPEVEGGVGGE